MWRKKYSRKKKDEKMEDYLKHEIMEGVKLEDAKGQKKKKTNNVTRVKERKGKKKNLQTKLYL